MDYNNYNKIFGYPSRLKPGITKLANNIDLPINYNLKLDGEEQPDNVEIATLVTKINSIKS